MKAASWLKNLSLGKKIGLGITTLFLLGTFGSPATQQNNETSLPANGGIGSEQVEVQGQEPLQVIEKKTVVETQKIAFESITQEDSTLTKGQTVIAVKGTNGARTLTYEVTFKDGVQTDKKLISDVVSKKPVNQITKIGTKVALYCPNGTYTNSAGNEVCSPYSSPSAPAGATAKCRDGTYSFSQSRRGTCSHHGGVAQWL